MMLASLTVMVLLSLISVQEDFLYGHKGWCAARRAVAARNFVEHGFKATQFGPVENIGPAEAEQFLHYWHHPVGIHLLVGASFSVLGEGPAQARLVVIILSLLSWLLVVDLSRRWWTSPWGHVAMMWLFGSVPMLAHYGPFVNQEPLVLFCCLASYWLHQWFQRRPTWSRAVIVGLFAIASAWSDWPWFLFAFFMALPSVWRVVTRRDHELKWLICFSAGVLLGFLGVVNHLALLQGNQGVLEAFDALFNQRGGIDSTSFKDLFSRSGPKWIELFTPTLLLASVVFIFWTLRAVRDQQLTERHRFAWVFGATGLLWVGMFRQGAWVHEYWAFYLAPFCVVAGAEVVARVDAYAARAHGRVGAVLAVSILLVAQTASGVGGTLNRATLPDSNLLEGEHWRHREVILSKWLAERTEPHEQVGLHDVILKTKFQVGYHLNRGWRKTRVTGRARTMPVPKRTTLSVVDLRVVPQGVQTRVIKDALRRFRVSVLDDYLIAHVTQPAIKGDPRLSCARVERQAPSLSQWWFGSMAYDPAEVVPDPYCEARLLLQAGYEALAIERLRNAPPPQTLRQQVTAHNISRRSTPLEGLDDEPALPSSWTDEMTQLVQTEHAGVRFGGRLELVGSRQTRHFAKGYGVELVLRVRGALKEDWRPYIDRLSKVSADTEGAPKKTDLVARAFPSLASLKPGDFVYVRAFAGLHRRHTWHRLKAGFWMPPDKRAGKKAPKGTPNRHLEVGDEQGITLGLGDTE